jgi:quercetin dioxygenase-like cupin family protein
MSDSYKHFADLAAEVQIPPDGILSRTLHNDDRLRVVLFAFSEGQELSNHTAPVPALLYFVRGEGQLTLGTDKVDAKAGTFAWMEPKLNHAILARSPLIMLLMMLK